MKTLVAIMMVALAFALRAQESKPTDATLTKKIQDWNDPKWWEAMKDNPKPLTISLGKSDFTVGGPLIENIRARPASSDASLIEKMRRWPLVGLFVPGPMPWPSGERKYFAWGERSTPWSTLGDHPIGGPQGGLVSVSY
jgi:hypothetical protein